MQVQLDLYNSMEHPGNDECAEKTIAMMTEQNRKTQQDGKDSSGYEVNFRLWYVMKNHG